MELIHEEMSNIVLLTVKGKIDIESSPELKRQVLSIVDSGKKNIYLDFSGVSFVNSSGLGAMINLLKELRKKNASMTIINPSNFIKSLFKLTQLDKIFKVYGSVEESIKNQ